MAFSLRNIPNARLRYAVLAIVFFIFASLTVWGFFSGIAQGRSMATLKSVTNIAGALGYFYADQGRYPSAHEYYDLKILTFFYLKAMPRPEDASGICSSYPRDFEYYQTSPQNFFLKFCLIKEVSGLAPGAHLLTEKGIR